MTLAHDLNMIVRGAEIAVRPVLEPAPVRWIQAAVPRAGAGRNALALLEALREVGHDRARRLGSTAA